MTEEHEFLSEVVDRLSKAGIPHMVTGSLGSSFHGEPRSTNDIDIVISPTEDQLEALLSSFGKGVYVPADAARSALRRRGMFNVIDVSGGWKADLIICKDREFSREELSRRVNAEIMGVRVQAVSPEDAILSKLEWASKGQSERQLQDAAGIVAIQQGNIDIKYLRKWAAVLEVSDLLAKILED
jgi:Aminoglycoside-2''-adenylyltransferase